MIRATVSSWSCFYWLYRASPSLAAKNIINLISVLTIWWYPCVESSLVLEIQRIPGRKKKKKTAKTLKEWSWWASRMERAFYTAKSNNFFQVFVLLDVALTFYSTAVSPEVLPLLVSIHHTLGSSIPTAPSDFFTGSVSPRPTHFLWFLLSISPLNSRHFSH